MFLQHLCELIYDFDFTYKFIILDLENIFRGEILYVILLFVKILWSKWKIGI